MKKFINKRIKNQESGFTIMETLVAIFILVLSITGPLVFSQTGLRTAFVSRDQMIAFYLAQDAIETIKNMRDQNFIDKDPWLTASGGGVIPFDLHTSFNIDTTKPIHYQPDFYSCTNDPCRLYKNASKQYVRSAAGGATPTNFYRKIYMRETNPGKEAQITVEVSWDTNAYQSGTRRVIVQENIFNWFPK